MSESPEEVALAELKNYLNMMVQMRKQMQSVNTAQNQPKFKYLGIEDFVLQHGQRHTPRVLPAGFKKGTPKECFSNAFAIALHHPELTYVEGYACGVIPTHHAWCIDADGNVIDPTWACDNKVKGESPGRTLTTRGIKVRLSGKLYFGVPLQTKYVAETIAKKRTYGVLENWENDFPLLTGEHDVADGKIIRR